MLSKRYTIRSSINYSQNNKRQFVENQEKPYGTIDKTHVCPSERRPLWKPILMLIFFSALCIIGLKNLT
jgi:hypothetical protein